VTVGAGRAVGERLPGRTPERVAWPVKSGEVPVMETGIPTAAGEKAAPGIDCPAVRAAMAAAAASPSWAEAPMRNNDRRAAEKARVVLIGESVA